MADYYGSNLNFGEVLLRALENQKQLNLQKKEQGEMSAAREQKLKLDEEQAKRMYAVQQRILENEQRQTATAEAQLGMQRGVYEHSMEHIPISNMDKVFQAAAKNFEDPNKPGYIRRADVPEIEKLLQIKSQAKYGSLQEELIRLKIEEMQGRSLFAMMQDQLRTKDQGPVGQVLNEQGEPVQLGSTISLSRLKDYKRSLQNKPYADDFESMLENLSPQFDKRQGGTVTFMNIPRDVDPGTGGVFEALDRVMARDNRGMNFANYFSTVTGVGGSRGWTPDVDILGQAEGAVFGLETVLNQINQGNIQGGQRSVWNPQRTLEEDVREAISLIKPRIEQYMGSQEEAISNTLTGSPAYQTQLLRMQNNDMLGTQR